MCNFIIRPVKCYATIVVEATLYDKDNTNPKHGNLLTGDQVTVNSLSSEGVNVTTKDGNSALVDLSLFVHAFSLKDPNKKDEKAKEAKSDKSKEA